MRTRRIAFPLAAGLAALLLLPAATLSADGGSGGGAGGGGSAPPSGPPPSIGAPAPPTVGPVGPPTSPTAGPPRTPGSGGRRGAGVGPTQKPAAPDSPWRAWWIANADALRPRRPERVTADGGIFRTGDASSGAKSDAGRATRRLLDRDALPLLRETIDAKHEDPDTVAAAAIAIGKVTADPADADRLLELLGRASANTQVRRAAAAGLGVLRRSDPKAAFDGRLLDRVRARLFAAVDDDKEPDAVRCFAAFSIGLLGDQPANPDDAIARTGRLVVRDLWTRLGSGAIKGDELPVALLVALSMQSRDAVPDPILDGLRGCAVTGRLGARNLGGLAQASAILAFSRLSESPPVGLLLGIAKSRSHEPTLRRAAIVALGAASARLDGPQRTAAAAGLLDVTRASDPDTGAYALLAIGRLLAADFAAGSASVLLGSDAANVLVAATDGSPAGLRPFAALALAIAARPAAKCEGMRTYAELRVRAGDVLRQGLEKDSRDTDTRGAFATALGLLADAHAAPVLLAIADGKGDPALKADACGALGLLGRPTPEVLAVLRASVAESADARVRREAARALGLLGDVASVPALLPALEKAGDEHVRSRAATALGAIGDPATITPLVFLARSPGVNDALKSLAASALGLVGDPESVPSLARLGFDTDHLSRTAFLLEAFTLF